MTRDEALARVEEIRLIPGITGAQRAAMGWDAYKVLDGTIEPTTITNWRTETERRHAAYAELVGSGIHAIGKLERIASVNPALVEDVASGKMTLQAASNAAGFKHGRVGIAGGNNNSGQGGINWGKGDRFDEAFHPAYLYLKGHKRRGFSYPHLSPLEAAQRVKDIDFLIEALTEARADLAPRSVRAQTAVDIY